METNLSLLGRIKAFAPTNTVTSLVAGCSVAAAWHPELTEGVVIKTRFWPARLTADP
jgi:hypothetical protein